ncbi:lactate/malate family dehydrogenase [Streptococcus downei]|uniref:Lactate/malate dehydrogenase, NAD binding domain protein n=1 Tax=Streptococcus downei MFe28 TaxID=764290 RepID=A0A380JEK0_STRDO|nr:NAD(P)-binding domain-containing protein [Streptococcus downei]EFQ57425.1 lactate/malate dehydrogenase, NAD binding domain protein [Streptococcus downei F0415]SUN36294.1 lactate/malate dehydrogenase, NAD binding domain protein [Streptococcus downei MFe28]
MARKVGIIGLGNVGSTLAGNLVRSGLVDELVLLDKREKKVLADKLDLEDSLATSPHYVKILANDDRLLDDADILVVAVGDIKAYFGDNPDRWVELSINIENAKEIAGRLKATKFSGVIVVVSNPCDAVTTVLQRELHYPQEKIMGTGTLLDTSRLKNQIAKASGLAPQSIQGYVLGEHGDSQFTAWSTVNLDQLGQLDKEGIEAAVRRGGQEVFNGKRYTNFAIASSTHLLVEAILTDSHQVLPVSNYDQDSDLYLSYPALIGRQGVLARVPLELTKEEAQKLEASAKAIKEKAFG